MTNTELAFKYIDDNNIHMTRANETTITLWIPGYRMAACHEIESDLMKLGFFCLSMDFDKQSGNTMCKYRYKV